MLIALPSMASEVVLDEIKIRDEGNETIIDILFGLPLKYKKHFPQKVGEIVQVQLDLAEEENGRQIHKEVREGGELLSPEGQKSVLVYVTYEEGVPGGPYLTLRFSHSVRFEVIEGPDRRSLTVKVFHDDPKLKGQEGEAKTTGQSSVDLMMAKARQAITFGNNKGAIELLRKVIRSPANPHIQQANELLGLALERDKQIPRAKYEYKKYLKRYPEGEGADRVKQRLAALREVRVAAKRKLRRSPASARRSQFITFGRFTQSLSEYYLDRDLEDTSEELQQRLLSSHFSIKSRYRGEDRTVQAIFNASESHDYLAKENREKLLLSNPNADVSSYTTDETDIQRMYIDVDDSLYGYTARVGRQSSRNGGVFGTFDGVIAGYHVTPNWLVSAMVGKPLIRTFSNIEIYEKFFYGVKADVESKDKAFGSDLFFVQQEVDGILDRQAIGGNLRYARKGLSLFGLLDYDLAYSELSLFNVRVGWNFTEANKLNFSYNRRNLVQTSQALNGMSGIYTIDQLLDYLPESEIRRIALERTQVYETITIGDSYQLTKDQQFNVDVTLSKSSAAPEGVNPLKLQELLAADPLNPSDPRHFIDPTIYAVEGTDYQYTYSFQWISSNTFVERDLYVAGVRYSDFDSYTDTSVFVNARVPLFQSWHSGFRLNLSKRDSASYGKRTTVSPVIKLSYRLNKAWSFDSEVGLDFVDNVGLPDETRRQMRLAYNYTF
jgi:outer membrane protein assembly factor BamD (BamD/ComL family)